MKRVLNWTANGPPKGNRIDRRGACGAARLVTRCTGLRQFRICRSGSRQEGSLGASIKLKRAAFRRSSARRRSNCRVTYLTDSHLQLRAKITDTADRAILTRRKYKFHRYVELVAPGDSFGNSRLVGWPGMHLQPLAPDHLASAQRVARELFPWEDEHQLALATAVRAGDHAHFLTERRLEAVRCWTAHDGLGAVSGLITVYDYRAQPDEVWLAWFGLLPAARGQGDGGRLLDWLIARSRAEGRHTLRLWTTDEAEYAAAVRLYQRRGFTAEDYPSLPGEDWRTRVFSLGLEGRTPLPWSSVLDRAELCGRQAAPAASLAA